MKVLLAGYNVDKEILDEINVNKKILTPETISAAYARISRDPRPVNELRKDATNEVEKARKSNENIVFKMGHGSIAEHSVFNIDIIGVSRYLIELIENHRLCSYTEKSQRYINIDDDYIIPDEIIGTRCQKIFTETIELQNESYDRYYHELKKYYIDYYPDMSKEEKKLYDNLAKEDARYILSLSTKSQLGMTANTRNIELMIKQCMKSKLIESKIFAKKLLDVVTEITPSLIRYIIPTEYEIGYTDNDLLLEYINNISKENKNNIDVELINSPDDKFTIANILYSKISLYKTFKEFLLDYEQGVFNIDENKFWKIIFRNLNMHDSLSREFEKINISYSIKMSASCFAQFKRHRMMTIISEPYSIEYEPTIPQSIINAGLKNDFEKIIEMTNKAYKQISDDIGIDIANYILTNAHNRRISVSLNVRELYAMARLRMDEHAQWDIKNIVTKMVNLAKENLPMTLSLACGKSEFNSIYQNFMNE